MFVRGTIDPRTMGPWPIVGCRPRRGLGGRGLEQWTCWFQILPQWANVLRFQYNGPCHNGLIPGGRLGRRERARNGERARAGGRGGRRRGGRTGAAGAGWRRRWRHITIANCHNGLILNARRKAARVERTQRRLVVNGGWWC